MLPAATLAHLRAASGLSVYEKHVGVYYRGRTHRLWAMLG